MVLLRDLNEDAVREILVRVPNCKTAIKCSSVCKTWQSMIEKEDFIKRFNRGESGSHNMAYTLVFTDVLNSNRPFDLSFPSGEQNKLMEFFPWWKERMTSVEASCDEFLVVKAARHICICNTLTKKWSFLPNRPKDRTMTSEVWGLARKAENFKVVFADLDDTTNCLKTKVFCSQSKQWTLHTVTFPKYINDNFSLGGLGLSSNGTLYFNLYQNEKLNGVVAYDPFDNICKCIELPQGFADTPNRGKIWLVRGRICITLMFQEQKGKPFSLKLWELDDHENSDWRLVREFKPRLPSRARVSYVIGLDPNDHNNVFFICNRADVCRYDIARETYKIFGHFPIDGKSRSESDWPRTELETFTIAHPHSWLIPFPKLRYQKRINSPSLADKLSKRKKYSKD